MPANVRSAGKVTPWPKKVTKDDDLLPLLAEVRKNELRQARAAAAAKKQWEKIQQLYGTKQ